jgi:hypothetical protein
MPMLLEAVPSFAEQWSEIEDDPMFLDEATGTRLHTDGDDYVKELASLAAGGAGSTHSGLARSPESKRVTQTDEPDWAAGREPEAPLHKSVYSYKRRGRTLVRIRPLTLVAGVGFEPTTSGL